MLGVSKMKTECETPLNNLFQEHSKKEQNKDWLKHLLDDFNEQFECKLSANLCKHHSECQNLIQNQFVKIELQEVA
jgi:hypothetical protein